MNKCEQIHETVVRDIVDIISDVKDSDQIAGIFNRSKSFRSANQATSNLILTFPCMVDKSTSIEAAAMSCKAVERKAVTMMQILFSAVALDNADNAIDFVKKYHTNLGNGDLSLDNFIDAVDKYVVQSESVIIDKEKYDAVKEDMRNISYTLPDTISETGINEYKIVPQARYGNTTIVKEKTYVKPQDMKNIAGTSKDLLDIRRNQILDSDIKKANELIPTMMVINLISSSGETPVELGNIVIGIKAKMYPIDTADIINRIKLKNEDRNGFNKFIRAATREISFWKDFVFAIDKAKIDAISNSKKGSSSKMWKVLERRALKSRLRRTLGQTNDATAITTLMISQDTVEYLKKNESIDLANPRIARPIMESYNLMGICIIDEAMEVDRFLFDTGDDNYETVSFSHLERESSDNTYKKVVNLMTKISR